MLTCITERRAQAEKRHRVGQRKLNTRQEPSNFSRRICPLRENFPSSGISQHPTSTNMSINGAKELQSSALDSIRREYESRTNGTLSRNNPGVSSTPTLT